MEIKINQSRNYSSFSTTKTFQDLSGEINNLMTQYKQLKKNRIQTEQDKCFLENKMKVLTKEKNKIKNRKNSAEKLRDRYNIIRVNVLNQKKLVNQRKVEIEKEKRLKKQKSQNIKRTIETTLSSWRIKVNSRNKEEGMKVKKEKEAINKIYTGLKTESSFYKKTLHDKIYNDKCQTERKRRLNTLEKKNTMRSYLEKKIKDEVNEINKLNSKMKNYRSQSIELLNKINNIFNNKESIGKKNKLINRPKSSLGSQYSKKML